MTKTSTTTALPNYTIKSGQVTHTLDTMTTSLAFCTITYSVAINGTAVTDSSMSPRFSFNTGTMAFTISISGNYYGNQQSTVTLTGTNPGNV